MPHFYSFLTFFPRTLCTITWVCLGAALGEYEEHKQIPSQQYDQQYRHQPTNPTNNTNNTRNTTTTNNNNTTTITTSHMRFQWLLPDSASYFGQQKWPRRFYQNPFYIFFPALFLYFFIGPFFAYLSFVFPCQVYFWRLMYIIFFGHLILFDFF